MPAPITSAALATAFVASLGVNTHIDFNRNGYQSLARVEQSITYLGVQNARDSARRPSTLQTWSHISRTTGVKFANFMTRGSPADMEESYRMIPPLAAAGVLNFIEGGNQQDSAYARSRGNNIAYTAQFQQRLHGMGRSLGLPVINMSFGAGWTAENNWKGNYDKVGDLSAYADYANAATYPMRGQKIGTTIRRINGLAKIAAVSRPVVISEIGWNLDAGFTEDEIAKNVLTAAFAGWASGSVKTYFYSLFDDDAGRYGLMNADGTPKAAGRALHNLTTLLADDAEKAARHAPGTLDFTLGSPRGSEESVLLQKTDGAYWLAVWDETNPRKATFRFAQLAGALDIYDPLLGTQPIKSEKNLREVSVSLRTYPLLIRIVPTDDTAAEKAVTALSPTAP